MWSLEFFILNKIEHGMAPYMVELKHPQFYLPLCDWLGQGAQPHLKTPSDPWVESSKIKIDYNQVS